MADPLKDPAVVEEILVRCLQTGDMKGVDAAIRVLAVIDPRRCDEIVDAMKAGLVLRKVWSER